MTLKIGIMGCAGRMGRALVRTVLETEGRGLSGGCDIAESGVVGQDVAEQAGAPAVGEAVTDDPAAVIGVSDAVIDFSGPDATARHAALARDHGTALVIGTTGLGEAQQAEVDAAAKHVPVVQAPNMSLGVNLLLALVEQVATALDPSWDVEITEMHHRHKKDAPSGTALALGRAAASGRGVDLDAVADRVRDGHTGPRVPGAIGFATLRGGDVVGEHSVTFAGEGERVEIGHKAGSRDIFARGAVKAAGWTAGRAPGLYGMRDVLGLNG